jgi:hypothetical protein
MSRPRLFDHDEAARLYLKGASAFELGQRYGVHRNSIYQLLDRRGIERRSRIEAGEKRIQHGAARYKKGCRCEVCRAAVAAQKRRQRQNDSGYGARQNRRRMERYREQRAA